VSSASTGRQPAQRPPLDGPLPILNNKTAIKLSSVDLYESNTLTAGNSTIADPIELSGPGVHLYSLSNNSVRGTWTFDFTYPPR
jgi:hypothetical protein